MSKNWIYPSRKTRKYGKKYSYFLIYSFSFGGKTVFTRCNMVFDGQNQFYADPHGKLEFEKRYPSNLSPTSIPYYYPSVWSLTRKGT